MAGNTHVPDKLHGYTLQVRHMMCELISLDLEKVVSVEALEDVAVESENSVIAEQIKSVQSGNNPIADRSEVFWKSLYNWYQYIKNGDLPLDNTMFRFIVISNRDVTSGEIPESFHAAHTDEDAKAALKFAQDTLWGTKTELKAQVPSGYSSLTNIENGQRLYFICQDAVRTTRVQGNDTPEFFGAGSLHSLANEPPQEPLIGWHPMYKDLLKASGDTNE